MSIRLPILVLFVGLLISACGGNGDSETERMAQEHEGDSPTATDATRAPEIPVTTRTVAYAKTEDGSSVNGYLAAPASPDSVLEAHGYDPSTSQLPGVVVIHEWWGLNDNIRAATRRLAGQGYRALAVDLYQGAVAQSPDSAQALMKRAVSNEDQMMANLAAARDHLRSEAGAPRVAVMGWCFGGGRTFGAVAASPTAYDAAVAYYGTAEPMTASVLKNLETPILAHFGLKDQRLLEGAKAFQSRATEAGASVQVHFYDAGHAFANPSGESYNASAAKTAWSRTTKFLSQHLYPRMSGDS